MNKSHIARKRFGQNFLTDSTIIENIINAIHPQSSDNLIEIGPGLGALTEKILAKNCSLTAIEIDRDLATQLSQHFQQNHHFKLYQADALTFYFATLSTNKKKMRVFGNLPYNISTPLQFHLFKFFDFIHDMHFMLQKEVVDRMAAKPGNKTYGRLSVMTQNHCQAIPLFNIPPEAFQPKPKVQSTFVRLIPYTTKPYRVKNYDLFSEIVRLAFNQRRKTIANALKSVISIKQWHDISIDPKARAEQLSIEQFVELTRHVLLL